MNQVQKFGFGLVDLRVVEQDGEPWFLLKDVAKALGLREHVCGGYAHSLKGIPAGDKQVITKTHHPEWWVLFDLGARQTLISESGLYKLVMRSDKPEARAFQDWVTRVVLPAIRKDGAYVMGEEKVATGELSEDELVMRAMSIMSRKVERLSLERDRLAQDNQILGAHMEVQAHAITAMQPAAAIGQAVGALRSTTVMDFARKLDGVDLQQVQKSLGTMNYLYRLPWSNLRNESNQRIQPSCTRQMTCLQASAQD